MKIAARSLFRSEKGISLVEVILAVSVVALASLLIASIPSFINSVQKSQHRSLAKNIAQKELDYLRNQGFATLANGTSNFADPDLGQLHSGTATYTISDCPGTVCTNGEVAKQVDISIHWSEGTETVTVLITTLVSQGGFSG
jgi:Tfp pilus assembly protein PilE